MNFFEAQARARRSTTKLVILFVIAVLAIVLSVNLVVAALVQLSDGHGRIRDPGPYDLPHRRSPDTAQPFGTPALFAGVTIATLLVIGGGSAYKIASLSSGGRAAA